MTFQLLEISTPFCQGRLRIFDSSIGVMRWIVGKVQEGLFCNAFIYLFTVHVDICYLFYQSTNVPSFYVIMQLHVSCDTSGAP